LRRSAGRCPTDTRSPGSGVGGQRQVAAVIPRSPMTER
jgi:hypothetical protein